MQERGCTHTKTPCQEVGRRRDGAKESRTLFSNLERRDDRFVARDVFAFQVVEESASLSHHEHDTAPRVIILVILLEMIFESLDAIGEDGDLYLR